MARTTYLDIPIVDEDTYWGILQPGDRFTLPRVVKKSAFFSRKKRAKLTDRSYLPVCSENWKGFTDQQKQDWKDVDPHAHPHGFRIYVADKSQRINLGIAGNATPNEYHQDLVGAIVIEAPAEEVKLAQYHPAQYYVYQRVAGKKSQYSPVSVTEALVLPLKITLNYKSNLVSTGVGSFAKFYATVRHFYQGRNIDTDLVINIPLISGWTSVNDTLSSVLGEASSYNLYVHLYKVTGTLLFDNPKAEHSAQNWVRDPYCNDISKTFTRAFYQVPKHWAAITLPSGTAYGSKYPT